MSAARFTLSIVLLHSVCLQPQINLYLTEWSGSTHQMQHDCLYVATYTRKESDPYQIISYCLTELPSQFSLKENKADAQFSFAQLAEQHVTSEQLYQWSAPMDIAEEYQSYLNQLATPTATSLATKIFYNCTPPDFGPQCQYVLYDLKSSHSTLDDFIHDYYFDNRYSPTQLTCYTHLQCDRGPSPACLDWSEICDEKVDCLNEGVDEKHCWQQELQQCEEDEYQCSNGQCVPREFYRDDDGIPDCLDQSDELHGHSRSIGEDHILPVEPSLRNEDQSCVKRNKLSIITIRSLTSSCIDKRAAILANAMFSIKPTALSEACWAVLRCMVHMPTTYVDACAALCVNKTCDRITESACPPIIYLPPVPVLLGHIYLVYKNANLVFTRVRPAEPAYVCYDSRLLHVPDDNKELFSFNNDTCRLFRDSIGNLIRKPSGWIEMYVDRIHEWLQKSAVLLPDISVVDDMTTMYQCLNSSKYIARRRYFDGVMDCYFGDDDRIESFNKTCPTKPDSNIYKCRITNECIPVQFFQNRRCECTHDDKNHCEDENLDFAFARNTLSFPTICDGFTHLAIKHDQEDNETDETHCEQWPLIHVYNRCDGFWHFPNGSDELGCDQSPFLNCPENSHICVSYETDELMCLPVEKANDGHVDCIGALDEPEVCRAVINYDRPETFHCKNDSQATCIKVEYVCDDQVDCAHEEDQRACKDTDIIQHDSYGGICRFDYESYGSSAAKILCRHFLKIGYHWRQDFTLDQRLNAINHTPQKDLVYISQSSHATIERYQPRCHRGLDLQVWLDKQTNTTVRACLCPPSFYGDTCQFQNQRVSLTLRLRATSDSIRIPFVIVVSLVDESDERTVYAAEQLIYSPTHNCQRKFNAYLLYATRPKVPATNYSVQIDVYERKSLEYRGSFIKSLNFPFLPVHRVAFKLQIPHLGDNSARCPFNPCAHGQCRAFFNDPRHKTFCQCHRGWSGRYCTIPHQSTCSSASLFLGKLANNRSLCVCPLHKMGARCLLDSIVCRLNTNATCLNGGTCIPLHEYRTSAKNFMCLCQSGFFGDRCEHTAAQLVVTLGRDIVAPSSIRIHFIEVQVNEEPIRTTTVKAIVNSGDPIIIGWSLPFHLAFVELPKRNYYLAVMQTTFRPSTIVRSTISASARCSDTRDLFNETFANFSLLRRVKYYHSFCQDSSLHLSCFYDEVHLCLCQQVDQHRVANCLAFDHHINLDCSGYSSCLNGGQCFQENTACPRVTICQCPVCFYGAQCHLSTNAFSFSLDAILGYHISPDEDLLHQPRIVSISMALTMVLTLAGTINGILSLITFQSKKIRESGCGIYLLSSSIVSLLFMIVFTLKFWILLGSHHRLLQNQSFLNVQCRSIDFLLRFCSTMDQWLTAFVSTERAYIIIKGVSFDQKRTRSIAKWTVLGLINVALATNVYEPIYRRLFNENNGEEKRIWCIADYPQAVRSVVSGMSILHFTLPFIIHSLSAFIIITVKARQRTTVETRANYRQTLKEQIQQHQHLLVGPCVLMILAIPRLIMPFTSGCMTSPADSWLFLLGYFISLIPPILTFVLFVLPSSVYKQTFRIAVSHYRTRLRI